MDKSIADFIKAKHQSGSTKEEIYKELLSHGKNLDDIEKAWEEVNEPQRKEDLQKKVIRIFVTFGALLVGAGIFSFVAANWQEMAKSLKVIVLITTMLGFYLVGYLLKEENKLEKTGEALILVGSLTYGASIFLIAQIFNIRASWPEGFILWFLGVIPVAYVFKSKTMFLIFAVVAAAAIFSEPLILNKPPLYPLLFLTMTAAVFLATFLTGIYLYFQIKEDKKED